MVKNRGPPPGGRWDGERAVAVAGTASVSDQRRFAVAGVDGTCPGVPERDSGSS